MMTTKSFGYLLSACLLSGCGEIVNTADTKAQVETKISDLVQNTIRPTQHENQ